MKNYKYYASITGLFTACLVISNILDTKIFQLGSIALPGGIILFPIIYVFGDMLTEVYGYANSRKVIWTGFAALFLMTVTSSIVKILPPAPFWPLQEEYSHIIGKVPRIIAASMTAYFLGEFVNSYVLAKLKVQAEGKNLAFRFIASTVCGQLVDTTVFVLVAFAGTMMVADLISVIISGWIFKVVWEVIALPVTIPLVKSLKRIENEDFFDRGTNFNPFKIS